MLFSAGQVRQRSSPHELQRQPVQKRFDRWAISRILRKTRVRTFRKQWNLVLWR